MSTATSASSAKSRVPFESVSFFVPLTTEPPSSSPAGLHVLVNKFAAGTSQIFVTDQGRVGSVIKVQAAESQVEGNSYNQLKASFTCSVLLGNHQDEKLILCARRLATVFPELSAKGLLIHLGFKETPSVQVIKQLTNYLAEKAK